MLFSIRKLFRRDRHHKRPRTQSGLLFLLEPFKYSLSRMLVRLKRKGDRLSLQIRGFTLIELLVAMLISTIIISTMLAFTINVMETDRREQAKVESQGEIQAALDYIADDLQEAVYIYDSDGLTRLTTDTPADPLAVPPVTAAPPQIPLHTTTPGFPNSTPVLVFWKRSYYDPKDEVDVGGATPKVVGCLEYGTTTTNGSCSDTNPPGSGRYVYSLVAYYLIYDNSTGTNPVWSNTARIGRWEIKEGILSSCQTDPINACPEPKPLARIDVTPSPDTNQNFANYWVSPDAGFRPFDNQGDKNTVMQAWRKAPANYDLASNGLKTLIDFIDDTPYAAAQDDGTSGNSPVDITIRPNTLSAGNTANADCLDPSIGVGSSANSIATTQRVPNTFQTASANKAENLSSFYVCVNSSETVARIYLRGNAFARLKPNLPESQRPITNQSSSFLTTGNVRAYGRGKLFLK